VIHARLPADKLPEKLVERAEFVLHLEEGPGVFHCRAHLEAITHQSGVLQKHANLARVVSGDHFRIESIKRKAIGVTFAEDNFPTQPGLMTLEDQKLKKLPVVMQGRTPFLVMVPNGEVGLGPMATLKH